MSTAASSSKRKRRAASPSSSSASSSSDSDDDFVRGRTSTSSRSSSRSNKSRASKSSTSGARSSQSDVLFGHGASAARGATRTKALRGRREDSNGSAFSAAANLDAIMSDSSDNQAVSTIGADSDSDVHMHQAASSKSQKETSKAKKRRKLDVDSGDDDDDNDDDLTAALTSTAAARKRKPAASGSSTSTSSKKARRSATASGGSSATSSVSSDALLSFSSLQVGTMCLVSVRNLGELDMTVNMPDGLVGHIALREVSDVMSDLVDAFVADDGDSAGDSDDDESSAAPALNRINEIFTVGQIFPAVVIEKRRSAAGAGGSRGRSYRINLSLRPSLHNQGLPIKAMTKRGALVYGAVRSLEERGYVIDLGMPKKQGFLPFSELPTHAEYRAAFPSTRGALALEQAGALPVHELDAATADKPYRPQIGQPVLLQATGSSGRIIHCTWKPSAGLVQKRLSGKNVSLHGLRPGALVKATVRKVYPEEGYARLAFLEHFQGILTHTHAGTTLEALQQPIAKLLPVGTELKARILYVNHEAKLVALTARPELLQLRSTPFPAHVRLGKLFEQATCMHLDPKRGLLLALDDNVAAFVPRTMSSNSPPDRLKPSQFGAGTQHTCRVVNFDGLNGYAVASMQPAVLKASFFSHYDVQPGTIVRGKVSALETRIIRVKIPGLAGTAICPLSQASDVVLTHPEKKFPVGKERNFRVLSVDAKRKRVILTAKRTLVKATTPPLASYEDASVGLVTHGYVLDVNEHRAIVGFYGDVRGVLSAAELKRSGYTEAPDAAYKVGQPVQVCVTFVSAQKKRLMLSPNLERSGASAAKPAADKKAANAARDRARAAYTPGSVHHAVLIKRPDDLPPTVHRDCLVVQLDDGTIGSVAPVHLTDHPAHHNALYRAYSHLASLLPEQPLDDEVEQAFAKLVVLNVDRHGHVHLSRKPSLVAAADSDTTVLPHDFAQLRVGDVLSGYVRDVKQFGVFVGFAGRLSALAPKSHLADRFVADTNDFFTAGQSVRALVTLLNTDTTPPRAIVSLKSSQVDVGDYAHDHQFAQTLFDERSFLEAHEIRFGSAQQVWPVDWDRYNRGALVSGVVEVKKTGVTVVDYPDADLPKSDSSAPADESVHGVKGVILGATSAELGEPVEGVVLDRNIGTRVIDVSTSASLIQGRKDKNAKALKKIHKRWKKLAKTGAEVSAVIERINIKERFMVLSVPSLGYFLARAATATRNLRMSARSMYAEGESVTARVVRAPASYADGGEFLLSLDLYSRVVAHRSKIASEGGKSSSSSSSSSSSTSAAAAAAAASAAGSTSSQVLSFIDLSVHSLASISEGQCIRGRVAQVTDTAVRVELATVTSAEPTAARSLSGFVHVSELADPEDVSTDVPKSLDDFTPAGQALLQEYSGRIGDILSFKVLSVPQNGDALVLSARPAELAEPGTVVHRRPTLSEPLAGSVVLAWVDRVRDNFLSNKAISTAVSCLVSGQLRGSMHMLETSSRLKTIRRLSSRFPRMHPVPCLVLGVDQKRKELLLSARRAEGLSLGEVPSAKLAETGAIRTGMLLPGLIENTLPGTGVFVRLSSRVRGFVHITNISDRMPETPLALMKPGELVKVAVIGVKSGGQVDLSLRKSHIASASGRPSNLALGPDAPSSGEFAPVKSLSDLQKGHLVRGYVHRSSAKGLLVMVGPHLNVGVRVGDLSDEFVRAEKVEQLFPVGKPVTGRVIATEPRVQLALKASVLEGTQLLAFEDLSVGQIVDAKVRNVTKYGVFLDIVNSQRLRGLCHMSEVTEDGSDIANLDQYYNAGDLVKAKILALEEDKKRISFGLKASYLEEGADEDGDEAMAEVESSSDEEDDEAEEEEEQEQEQEQDQAGGFKLFANSAAMEVDSEDSDSDSESSSDEDGDSTMSDAAAVLGQKRASAAAAAAVEAAPVLNVSLPSASGSLLFANAGKTAAEDDSDSSSSDSSDSDDSDSEEQTSGMSKRARASARKREERMIEEREAALMDENRQPETAADFERMLVAEPNNSGIWVRYMHHLLSQMETERARAIGERALTTINFKEEAEKFNVWVALLALEASAGSSATLQATFKRACQYNEKKPVYLALARILTDAGKMGQAEEMYKKAARKFRDDAEVWRRYGQFKFASGHGEQAHELLPRALRALPKREHVPLIRDFAQFEYKQEGGEIERGRTLFEGILAKHSRRTDIWSVYADMEQVVARQYLAEGRDASRFVQHVRNVLDRAVALNLSPKKMQFLFTKYMAFETDFGDESTLAAVQTKAREYVARATGAE